MNNEFNGERLKKARIYRGITVAELANRIDCQRQTVSMYENGKSKPMDDSIIENISKELKFPPKFFLERTNDITIGTTYFRALLTTNKRYRAEQVQKMEFVAEIYNFLKDYIVFPPLNLPDFGHCTPEEAAVKLREDWGLGDKPIENIIHVVEEHGILVTSFSTSTDDIDAFSQMITVNGETVYLIGYSNNKTSAARIHFDIAHELGHICLHEWSEDVEMLERDEFKEREKEANQFASALLLPENSFKADLSGKKLRIPYYTELKRKWKVSIQAMNRRAYNLGVITSDEYQIMIRTLQRRGLRKEEPLDDVILTAEPSLLKTSILMLLNEEVFTPKEFMDELSFSYNLSLSPEEIEYLLDLPEDTLTPSKILQFPTLRLK
ncbi:XRE family transcriptional regulator [Anaerovorax odorimutans]|uniref:XRE family transcriptional regulator n=1 Tax=Anaerovorax odorimutans TaxID=109327 RepID=A0ABT1RTP3_9FIRM|nr:XRE family transcriptional regulator [Anaerovorax odorimutans]MCQ4638567.1 XRE family transcriptional regulator [Anaerovorax odorimutans]